MNTDPKKSTTWCGCDEGANHLCERHRSEAAGDAILMERQQARQIRQNPLYIGPPATPTERQDMKLQLQKIVKDAKWRKERPLYSGCIAYFPDALMEVAYVSYIGNQQHNPGQPLHWAKEKSADHLDAEARHLANHSKNPVDSDGALHLAKNAWRALAELQTYLDNQEKA